jgi:superfamily I DNA and/or RNA helicase
MFQQINSLETKDIYFSQSSVSPFFSDGRSISHLTKNLMQNVINVTSIPNIRVVNDNGKWVTLDNRGLRAFKDAKIDKIAVIVCDLNDSKVKEEFHSKKTNKSSYDGGSIRNLEPHHSQRHFKDGPFVFVKRILNLTFEQLKKPLGGLKEKQPLSAKFSSVETYYESFLDLILEEARAELQVGIEKEANESKFEIFLLKNKMAKKAENPSVITFTKKSNLLIKVYDAFLLESSLGSIRLLALANYELIPESSEIEFKVVVEQDVYNRESLSFNQAVKWYAKPIGSLVTYLRMFDVCTAKPKVEWLKEIFTGVLSKKILSQEYFFEPEYSSLNQPQKDAMGQFLGLDCGLQLVQGPPGTGKTTMVISLLKLLSEQGRVLVCAPSNKAVHILANRFTERFPEIPSILVGDESKIGEDNINLNRIFIHSWRSLSGEIIANFKKEISGLLPRKLFERIAIDEVKERIDKAISIMKEQETKLRKQLSGFFIEFEADLQALHNAASEYEKVMVEKREEFVKITQENSKKIVINVDDLFDFSKKVGKILNKIETSLNNLQRLLEEKILSESSGLEARLLNNSRVIFSTLSVSGRKLLKEMQSVNALIVDEAGQATEAETLIPLFLKSKKCLLIGDTKQLSSIAKTQESTRLKFDRSMMSRLLEDCNQDYTMLTVQYRMHPEIRCWPSQQYYENKLVDTSEIALKFNHIFSEVNIPQYIAPYSFLNVNGHEKNIGNSFQNESEVDCIIDLLGYLKKELSVCSRKVSIITFYQGQSQSIKDKVEREFSGVKVNTVDSFQGDENDFIIISCVRANISGRIGFLNDFRRLNVALTRAKYSLIIVGNAQTLEKSGGEFNLLIKDARERKCFFEYKDVVEHLKYSTGDLKRHKRKMNFGENKETKRYRPDLMLSSTQSEDVGLLKQREVDSKPLLMQVEKLNAPFNREDFLKSKNTKLLGNEEQSKISVSGSPNPLIFSQRKLNLAIEKADTQNQDRRDFNFES